MDFKVPLQQAVLIKRYKRFLADIELPDGKILTVHCPNSGSMMGCSKPGSEVMISKSPNPNRKYPYTLEMIKTDNAWAGINTSLTNSLVRDAIEENIFPELGEISEIKPEIKVGNSRLDFLLINKQEQTYLEVKNCTLVRDGVAMFPDALTTRGLKHLQELIRLSEIGYKTAMIFCVQREDAHTFAPASDIDPEYALKLSESARNGVMVFACQAEVSPQSINVVRQLPVDLSDC